MKRPHPALLVLLVVLGGCRTEPKSAIEAAPRVEGERIQFPEGAPALGTLSIRPVESGEAVPLRFTGRLAWDENATVRVYSPVLGRVGHLFVDVGQSVPAGAPLALLQSPDFGQAQSDAARARADLRASERNLARAAALVERGAAARKELDAAEAEHARSQAEQQRAEGRLALYGGQGPGVDQRFLLRSPIGGVVVERALNPGQEVRPDAPSPLLVISDPRRLWVQVDVGEREVGALRPGSEMVVRSRAFPGRSFPGRLEVLGDALDPATRTLKARGRLPNPERLLKAEMYVEVEFRAASARPALFVPTAAAVSDGPRAYVFVEEGPGRFRRQSVRTGAERDGRVEIQEGLAPGSKVVTEGGLLLQSLLSEKG